MEVFITRSTPKTSARLTCFRRRARKAIISATPVEVQAVVKVNSGPLLPKRRAT